MAILLLNSNTVNNGNVTVGGGEIPNTSRDRVATGDLPAGQVKFQYMGYTGVIEARFRAGPVWTVL